MDLSEIEIRDRVPADNLPDLMALFATTWWAAGRTTEAVTRMLAASYRARPWGTGFAPIGRPRATWTGR